MRKLAVFDICGTLYACNTTLEFARYVLTERGDWSGAATVGAFAARWSPAFLFDAALTRITRRDFARRYTVRRFSGLTRTQLQAFAKAFVDQRLPAYANVRLHQALIRHLDIGDEVVLISNSLDIVVDAIGDSLGVKAFASTIEFEDGVCVGVVQRDIQGLKHEVLDRFINNRDARVVVYTDNLTDRELLSRADERYVVIPRGRSKYRWGDIDANFIEL